MLLIITTEQTLTAIVPTALSRAAKKNASTESRVAYQLKEQKRSRFDQNTLLVEGFKYGLLLCLFVRIR